MTEQQAALKVGDVLEWMVPGYHLGKQYSGTITRATPVFVWCGKRRFRRTEVGAGLSRVWLRTPELVANRRARKAEDELHRVAVTPANVDRVEKFLAEIQEPKP